MSCFSVPLLRDGILEHLVGEIHSNQIEDAAECVVFVCFLGVGRLLVLVMLSAALWYGRYRIWEYCWEVSGLSFV